MQRLEQLTSEIRAAASWTKHELRSGPAVRMAIEQGKLDLEDVDPRPVVSLSTLTAVRLYRVTASGTDNGPRFEAVERLADRVGADVWELWERVSAVHDVMLEMKGAA
jgi:hypothetical protein